MDAIMSIKDALLVLTTYPQATATTAIQYAVTFAGFMGCRMTAFAADLKIEVPRSVFGNSMLNISGMIAAETRKSKDNTLSLLAAFNSEAEKQGVAYETIHETGLAGEIPGLMAEYARLKDLTIIPLSDADDVDQWHAETIVFQSGRPILVVPEGSQQSAFKLDTVAVAWDYSRTAARAVADAIPLLQRAKTVRILTVTNEKVFDASRATYELATHLSRHGISVSIDEIDAGGKNIGTVMEQFIAAKKIDLMVMGAYGHSRLREFVLGGATKSMLSKPPVPVFLSH
jgi:nucleotide-binding universal stress UspA family protein